MMLYLTFVASAIIVANSALVVTAEEINNINNPASPNSSASSSVAENFDVNSFW